MSTVDTWYIELNSKHTVKFATSEIRKLLCDCYL